MGIMRRTYFSLSKVKKSAKIEHEATTSKIGEESFLLQPTRNSTEKTIAL
jgi:hypothetical protein